LTDFLYFLPTLNQPYCPMRTIIPLLCCLFAFHALAQESNELAKTRPAKIEAILRIENLRTPHDGKLTALLSDADPIVRKRAYLAYASIQDSSLLPLLTRGLADPLTQVQEAAAFAIGQTGTTLSERMRKELEHDLIWNRLHATQAADQLIEELGKFGTSEALDELMTRIGKVHPQKHAEALTMSLARFAIRGITSADGVRYLIERIKTAHQVPWQAVYALQRIGDHPETRREVEHLALLRHDHDPLVRMNLAQLFGKLRDQRITRSALIQMAESDGDWRVRVAAIKSLGTYPIAADAQALDVFNRAFFDANQHIAITALSALRSANLQATDTTGTAKETLVRLKSIADNNGNGLPWQLQAEAAITVAQILHEEALPHLNPDAWPNPLFKADILRAMGSTGSNAAQLPLFASLYDKSPIVRCGALDGLSSLAHMQPRDKELRKAIREVLPELCDSRDIAVTTTVATMLGDTLFTDARTTGDLMRILARLRGADDVEGIIETIRVLGEAGDSHAAPQIAEYLLHDNYSVVRQAAASLRMMTGVDYSANIQYHMPPYTDFDFAFLNSLPDTIQVTIATGRGDIKAEFYKNLAPFTIMSILKLSSQRGFYRGLSFHRVVPNFVIQGGCPRGDGWGGPGFTLRSEFSPAHYETGTIGIASAGKDTEGSQFFITHSPQPHLDGRYTIIGRVLDGEDIVDSIQRDDRLFDIQIHH
jgi:cyclophilin family peptidyl-prolyl cis-trans isomerase